MGLVDVWKRFVMFIEGHLDHGSKKGIIAAWGGQSCDCEWLFRITKDTHHGVLFMPRWCPYFMDPKKVVSHYGSCKLNQKHFGVIGYRCDEMWCHVTGNPSLPGAHPEIADARAQCTIVADKRFFEFIDKPVPMIGMVDVWASKNKIGTFEMQEATLTSYLFLQLSSLPCPPGSTMSKTTRKCFRHLVYLSRRFTT
jgi:hypothetical protein